MLGYFVGNFVVHKMSVSMYFLLLYSKLLGLPPVYLTIGCCLFRRGMNKLRTPKGFPLLRNSQGSWNLYGKTLYFQRTSFTTEGPGLDHR